MRLLLSMCAFFLAFIFADRHTPTEGERGERESKQSCFMAIRVGLMYDSSSCKFLQVLKQLIQIVLTVLFVTIFRSPDDSLFGILSSMCPNSF